MECLRLDAFEDVSRRGRLSLFGREELKGVIHAVSTCVTLSSRLQWLLQAPKGRAGSIDQE